MLTPADRTAEIDAWVSCGGDRSVFPSPHRGLNTARRALIFLEDDEWKGQYTLALCEILGVNGDDVDIVTIQAQGGSLSPGVIGLKYMVSSRLLYDANEIEKLQPNVERRTER